MTRSLSPNFYSSFIYCLRVSCTCNSPTIQYHIRWTWTRAKTRLQGGCWSARAPRTTRGKWLRWTIRSTRWAWWWWKVLLYNIILYSCKYTLHGQHWTNASYRLFICLFLHSFFPLYAAELFFFLHALRFCYAFCFIELKLKPPCNHSLPRYLNVFHFCELNLLYTYILLY